MAKRLVFQSVMQEVSLKRIARITLVFELYDLFPGEGHLVPKFKDLPEDVQTAFREWINEYR